LRKIIPFLVIGLFFLSSFGAVAVSEDKETLNREEWAIEIDGKGGFFGYTFTVTNIGEESITGDLTINITTDAGIMLLGRELSETPDVIEALSPGETVQFKMGPVLGFGFADITITGEFLPYLGEPYPFDMETSNGFVLLLFVRCGITPITIPPR
jgi:hypothetical protein